MFFFRKEAKPLKAPHLVLGKNGEEAAASYLRAHGYTILARNWRHGHNELDIVAEKGESLVFVEVKCRTVGGMLHPLEAYTPAKARRVWKAASDWVRLHNAWERPCQVDVICVTANQKSLSVEHFPHVCEPVADSSHAAW